MTKRKKKRWTDTGMKKAKRKPAKPRKPKPPQNGIYYDDIKAGR